MALGGRPVLLVLLVPVADHLPALAALGLLAAVCVATITVLPELTALALLALVCVSLIVVETRWQGERRRRIRRLALEEELAAETDRSRWRAEHL
ncbi:hypothetical protein [Micromonospora sp. DT47]|uniref:hypothetical protein n=1 Tax=Micromonospora sp. DT47 TaxID=3393431 RepID=UPI003CE7C566